ncbi:hypothetical protein [Planococcus lenghuensis]|uniref:Uncharacterized protein n=1 Tax=Planococcus lenghuensis TaxID=2213202 RepID=A0A1Q2L5K4_9BACL|nr:hypothetical protein [Planococcus lenghuensis]AQQ55377.1 hypothetical protein B0X71_19600 [Planococcus lenghuensis]
MTLFIQSLVSMELFIQIGLSSLLLLEEVLITHANWMRLFPLPEDAFHKKTLDKVDIETAWGLRYGVPEGMAAAVLSPLPKDCSQPQEPEYVESQLDEEHEAFLASLYEELAEPETSTAPSDFDLQFGPIPADSEEEPVYTEDSEVEAAELETKEAAEVTAAAEETEESEYLLMEDWHVQQKPVAIRPQLTAKSTHSIRSNHIGEQEWVVEIIGHEQEYIHVSDGDSRTWLNVANDSLGKGDILSVLVHRAMTGKIEVKKADILQKKSLDFALELENEEEFYNLSRNVEQEYVI